MTGRDKNDLCTEGGEIKSVRLWLNSNYFKWCFCNNQTNVIKLVKKMINLNKKFSLLCK